MDKKTYYVSPLTWILSISVSFMALFFVYFAIIAIPQILTMDNLFFLLLMLFSVIALMLFVVYTSLLFLEFPRTRLEISQEGVIFSSNGYRIYTPWENIAGVGWTRHSHSFPTIIQLQEPAMVDGISFEEAILSRRAVTEKQRWWISTRQLKTQERYTHSIRIPVVFFRRKDKQDGSINQYLQHYLPHLMEARQ